MNGPTVPPPLSPSGPFAQINDVLFGLRHPFATTARDCTNPRERDDMERERKHQDITSKGWYIEKEQSKELDMKSVRKERLPSATASAPANLDQV